MSDFNEKTTYACPDCGHTESVGLHGWGKAPDRLKCPVCYGMMTVVEEEVDG